MSRRRLAFQKSIVLLSSLFYLVVFSCTAVAEGSGKEIFETRCAVCHHIGGGRLIGPDLAGVRDRRADEWLHKFIKSSQGVVQSGDATAKALFEEYNKMIMPDQALSDAEITATLDYIKEKGSPQAGQAQQADATQSVAKPSMQFSPEEVLRGQNLFQGKIRFAKEGPSCISCHNVETTSILSGGILAKELTTAYSRLGEQGLSAILASPPFPVMNSAFNGKALTPEEVRALVGFLKLADRENSLQQPREYGWTMFGAGSLGVVVLMAFFAWTGRRRKRSSVNQDIFDRQVKSE